MNEDGDFLIKRFFSGDRRAIARLITLVENEDANAERLLDSVFHRTGIAYRIGVTGPPGAGKSTLVDQMAKQFRKSGKTVGIVAVDPSSPFTGGALLGDRVRMSDLSIDPGVFIRSMATRGSRGGLARRTQEVADLLDAFGMDVVIFETVGVGQSELDVVEAADTTVVVLVPESGDSIQAMKAGLMEIGDVFVINKSDREGAERTFTEVGYVLELKNNREAWTPPVLQTVASLGQGIDELIDSLNQHREYQKQTDQRQRKQKQRIEKYVRQIIQEKLVAKFWQSTQEQKLSKLVEQILTKMDSPYRLSEKVILEFCENMNNAD